MKVNNSTNYKGRPAYYVLVHSGSPAMKTIQRVRWPKLTNRRTSHRLVLFYKILNDLTPQYLKHLCNLIPHNTNNYQLRRNNSFLVPLIHRESFSKSYFPKTIRDWNKLPNDVKQSQCLNIFKTRIRSLYEPLVQNKLYSYGHGLSKVNHCRIRLGLSHLNFHLHRYNLVDSPSCSNPDCGGTTESEEHYFLIALNSSMKDDYYLKIYQINYFQTLIIIHLLH